MIEIEKELTKDIQQFLTNLSCPKGHIYDFKMVGSYDTFQTTFNFKCPCTTEYPYNYGFNITQTDLEKVKK